MKINRGNKLRKAFKIEETKLSLVGNYEIGWNGVRLLPRTESIRSKQMRRQVHIMEKNIQ